jgi:CDP-diacylglycerol--glycerol-3-phosphate 3-phosphatidyltransferase
MFLMPRALPKQITYPVVAVLAKLGVTPNMLTVAQLVVGTAAGYVVATGELFWGGVVMIVGALLDAFDGTLARTTGKVTKFGGVFDSTVDRLFEGVVLAGVLYYYLERGDKLESMLVFVAAVGSLSVSYVRARAGQAGIELYDGIFTRAVRLILLAGGLFIGNQGLTVILWVLAVMTILTTLHRLFVSWQRLTEVEAKERQA